MTVYSIHAGHTPKVQGANKYLNEVKEARKVKDYLIAYLKAENNTVFDDTDDKSTTQDQNINTIIKNVNNHKNVALSVSIHLNSGGGTGCEVWNYDTRTKAVSDRICANLSKALGIKNRGTKYNKTAYGVIRDTKPLAIIVECAFVDSKIDAEKWNAKACAKAIAEGILNKKIGEQISTPSEPKIKYYPKPGIKQTSIVDGLKLIKINSGFLNRFKIWSKNKDGKGGIYKGTPEQNIHLLNLLNNGKLKK